MDPDVHRRDYIKAMAQVPKIYAPTPAQSVAAARGMPVSKVASLDNTVNEPDRSNVTSYEEGFVLREEVRQEPNTQNHPQRHLPHHSGRLIISSQFFTSLMSVMQQFDAKDRELETNPLRTGKMIRKAIQTYETNAKVIYGNPDITGTRLSMRL